MTKIYLKKSGADVLRQKGVNIKNNSLIGISTNATKGPGSKEAYSNALNKLEEYGITNEWVSIKNAEKSFGDGVGRHWSRVCEFL